MSNNQPQSPALVTNPRQLLRAQNSLLSRALIVRLYWMGRCCFTRRTFPPTPEFMCHRLARPSLVRRHGRSPVTCRHPVPNQLPLNLVGHPEASRSRRLAPQNLLKTAANPSPHTSPTLFLRGKTPLIAFRPLPCLQVRTHGNQRGRATVHRLNPATRLWPTGHSTAIRTLRHPMSTSKQHRLPIVGLIVPTMVSFFYNR